MNAGPLLNKPLALFALPALAAAVLLAVAGPARAQVHDCLIEPAQTIELRTSVEGLIEQIHVRRGDSVRRGQVLVELQSRPERVAVEAARYRAAMQGQVAAARNRIDYTTRKAARATELQAEALVSAQAREEAEAERRLAESELQVALEAQALARIEHERAVEQLALRTLTSPIDGVVVDRMLNPGDLAESGTGRKPVLKLAQIDPLRVDVVLPASAWGRVRAGTRVTIAPQGLPGRYAATVKMVDRVVDAASGTLVARVELPNRSGALPAGIRCKADFGAATAPAPAAADAAR